MSLIQHHPAWQGILNITLLGKSFATPPCLERHSTLKLLCITFVQFSDFCFGILDFHVLLCCYLVVLGRIFLDQHTGFFTFQYQRPYHFGVLREKSLSLLPFFIWQLVHNGNLFCRTSLINFPTCFVGQFLMNPMLVYNTPNEVLKVICRESETFIMA